MRTIAEFMKTTLIGGFLIVLPVYVSLLLLAKAFQGLVAAVKPITAGNPGFRGISRDSYTVLVPSVPTPMAGALYILPPERVHPVDVPFTVALKVFSKWGTGAGEFVRAMQVAKPSQAASSPA
jgi:uncharacterized membrane protein